MKCGGSTEFKIISVIDFFEPLPALQGEKQRQIKVAKELVDKTVKEIQEKHPECTVSGDLLNGYAKQEILKCAREWPADLIVVGSHGRTGVAEFVLGSISHEVLVEAPCAMRIVRESKSQDNVLLAMDTSEYSKHALEHVLRSSFASGTKFKCVTVNDKNAAADDDKSKTQSWLEECVTKLNDKFGADSATYEMADGEPKKKIVELAASWPAGLVVLGSHGHNALDLLILGSVSEWVALHAPCSVEIARMPVESAVV
jgi:nucleotide-binding universal stress UspA family protein